MLLAIRDKITGIVAWGIVLLISIPFVFFGLQDYFSPGGENYAVIVNGEEVPMNDYDFALGNNRQVMLQQFGGRFPEFFDAEAHLRKQTLDQLIRRELILQVIDKYNYRISTQQVAQVIQDQEYFKVDGKFDPEAYQRQLQSVGYSQQRYELEQAQQTLANQIQSSLQATAFVSSQELNAFAKLNGQTRDFDYAKLPLSAYKTGLKVEEAAIAEYYEANKDGLKTDAKVSIEYVELKLSDLAAEVAVDEPLLESLYQDAIAQGSYVTEESREASHILIQLSSDADDAATQAKQAEAEAVLAELKAGKDFAALAKDKSNDPGSASKGGSLGEVRRGQQTKTFEDALFALEEGAYSDVVKTRFGFHIIKADKIKPPVTKPFAEVRADIEAEYRSEQAEKAFSDKIEVLANLSFEQNDGLSVAADGISTEVQSTELFTADNGEGIAKYHQIRTAAFDDQVLLDGRNSDIVEVDTNHAVVLRLKEQEASRSKTLDEARTEIIAELETQQAKEKLLEAVKFVESQANDDNTFQDAVKKYAAEYKAVEAAKRVGGETPREILDQAFALAKPNSSELSVKRIELLNGDQAIVRLKAVKDGDIQWLQEQEREQLTNRLLGSRGRFDFAAALADIKENATIVINTDLDTAEDSETDS